MRRRHYHDMVPTVMESHGKSWKMERVMEKSWNFNHLFSEKNSWAAKINKTDGKSRVWQKMQPKCAIFRQKSQKFSGEGHSPLPRPYPHWEGNTPDQTAHTRYIFVHLLFGFLGIARIKVVMEKYYFGLEKSWKLMEIDFSKVVGTMLTVPRQPLGPDWISRSQVKGQGHMGHFVLVCVRDAATTRGQYLALLQNVPVKEFRKSINIWRRYGQWRSRTLFETRCMLASGFWGAQVVIR